MLKQSRLMQICLASLLLCSQLIAQENTKPDEKVRPLKVAFVVSRGFTLIDFAGPWEVFNVARLPVAGLDGQKDRQKLPALFELYAVSSETSPVETGLSHTRLVPDYTFANVPKPDIIVVGAQDWRADIPGLADWLKKEHADGITIMSVCIGAGELAAAGLLDGKQATTHHAFVAKYREAFPKTTWLEAQRYVQSSETVWTSGGLTSGMDLALHILAVRFGQTAAEDTARYLEYTGMGWK